MHRIVVNVQNQVGEFANVTKLLADEGINIASINSEVRDDYGLIFITTADEDYHHALEVVTDAGYRAISDECLVIRLKDEPGALAKVADRFRRNDVNILSLHIVNRAGGYTTVSLSADDNTKAMSLVADQLVMPVFGA